MKCRKQNYEEIWIVAVLILLFFISIANGVQVQAAEESTIILPVQGQSNNISWSIDMNGKLILTGSGAYEVIHDGYPETPWTRYAAYITSAEVSITCPTSLEAMFYNCSNLTTVKFINFDTSAVTNMSRMFAGCTSLTAADVDKWNTGNVTDMLAVFEGCSLLTYIDVTDWDMSKVEDIGGIFKDCVSLTTIDVSNWNTSKVQAMGSAFYNCISLKTVNVSNWDTGNVKYMYSVFGKCMALESVDVSNWDTGNVIEMNGLFSNCKKLESLEVSNWNTGNVQYMDFVFDACTNLKQIDLSNWDLSYVKTYKGFLRDCANVSTMITLRSDNAEYASFFSSTATEEDAEIWLRYSGYCTKEMAEKVIATKGTSSHVYLYGEGELFKMSQCIIELSADDYTYTGKEIVPQIVVKSEKKLLQEGVDYTISYDNNIVVGTTIVVVTGIGNYEGSIQKSFIIKAVADTSGVLGDEIANKESDAVNNKIIKTEKPAATKLIRVKRKTGSSILVNWKKRSNVTGYEIQYSTHKRFKVKNTKKLKVKSYKTTSKTIKKVNARKKYYVRIRTYKTIKVNGKCKMFYSAWSKTKIVCIKI